MSVVIISGSRRITDYRIVDAAIRASGFTVTKIIEGGQRTWDKTRTVYIGGVAIPDRDSRGTTNMVLAARLAGISDDRIYVHYDAELFPEGPPTNS